MERAVIPVRKRLRFREEGDLALLTEVAGQNPFQNIENSQIIQEHMVLLTTKTFSIKTLKDHLDLRIKIWLEKTKIMTYTSGTEQDYTEKEQLCQNIYDLMTQFRTNPKKKFSNAKRSLLAGKTSREMWAQNSFSIESPVEMDITNDPQEIMQISKFILDHDYISSFSNGTDALTIDIPVQSNTHSTQDILNISLPSNTNEEKELSTSSVSHCYNVNSTIQQPEKLTRSIRSRKRKINVQRQGLSYLEQYDKAQMELRREKQKIDERKLSLEESLKKGKLAWVKGNLTWRNMK